MLPESSNEKIFMQLGVRKKNKATKNRWKITQNEDVNPNTFIESVANQIAVIAANKIGLLSLKDTRKTKIASTVRTVIADEISKIIVEDR